MSKRDERKKNSGEKPLYVARKSIFAVLNIWWIVRFIIALGFAALSVLTICYICKNTCSTFFVVFCILDMAADVVWIVALIWKLVRIKTYRLKIYKNKIVTKIGIMVDYEAAQELFLGITAINMDQGFWGNLHNFGDVRIACIGRPDIFVDHLVDPRAFVRFMSKHFVNPESTRMLIYN